MTTSHQELEVMVHTSPGPTCGSFNQLWLSVIGSQGETQPIRVNKSELQLQPGSMCPVLVKSKGDLGRLLLVRLRLEARTGFPDQDWHCSHVEVCWPGDTPECPDRHLFRCSKWLQTADGDVELRSGKLCLLKDETEEKLKQLRLRQLQHQQKIIRWRKFVDDAPQCLDVDDLSELGPNLSYIHKSPAANLQYLKELLGRRESWTSFTELETVFLHSGQLNNISKFVQAHWMDDWYFGYQCLNGCNPLLLRQTRILPPNLSVTSDMLRPFLPESSSLEEELQKGNMYLLDYKLLDGVPANVINGKQSYLSSPLCLLHLNQQGQLLPIAIQLQQTPGPQNPVFLPSDGGCDWLLAKIWVRSADFHSHQLISHYLRTHMLGELSCVATLRHLPEPHPLHHLLMSHVQTTLQINLKARNSMLAPGGVFDQSTASSLQGIPVLLSRGSQGIQYRALCVPDDLEDRGVDKLPQSYYGQDALRVWNTLHSFVCRWVDLYYSRDDDVQQDSELQHWISDITTHGFTHSSGFPQSFQSKAEVSQFVTMIIFSCTALHAAVNFSQLDFSLWMPNCPAAMMRPPPQVKGAVTEEDIMSFLPDVRSTGHVLIVLTLLAQSPNFVRPVHLQLRTTHLVPLCHYRESVFRDDAHRRLVEDTQVELQAISDDIRERNSQLELPYPYLCPECIENSVSI